MSGFEYFHTPTHVLHQYAGSPSADFTPTDIASSRLSDSYDGEIDPNNSAAIAHRAKEREDVVQMITDCLRSYGMYASDTYERTSTRATGHLDDGEFAMDTSHGSARSIRVTGNAPLASWVEKLERVKRRISAQKYHDDATKDSQQRFENLVAPTSLFSQLLRPFKRRDDPPPSVTSTQRDVTAPVSERSSTRPLTAKSELHEAVARDLLEQLETAAGTASAEMRTANTAEIVLSRADFVELLVEGTTFDLEEEAAWGSLEGKKEGYRASIACFLGIE